jgi:hypothetical protein
MKEHRVGCLRIVVLGKIFGHKREKVAGESRRLQNEQLDTLYP